MDEDLVNLRENSPKHGTENSESGKSEESVLRELEETQRKIGAKQFAAVRGMNKQSETLENLACCVLMFFGQDVPRTFCWEPVAKMFANPSPLIVRIRNCREAVKDKKIGEGEVREMAKRLKSIDKGEVEKHKNCKEIQVFVEFFEKFCEFYVFCWPGCLEEKEVVKKRFKVPVSKKKMEEDEMVRKINKEKRALQELRYLERKMKWEEERSIKKEMKQEELRDLQREINFSKNLEDEFKQKQESHKKQEKPSHK